MEWQGRVYTGATQISLETLRAMVLVNGAAIIASVSILSGLDDTSPTSMLYVTKLTIFSCSISLVMLSIGHAINFEISTDCAARVRGTLVGNPRHSKLYAIGRYLERYMEPKQKIAAYFIYGSIIVFGFNALISSLILISI